MKTIQLSSNDPSAISTAIHILKQKGVIAFPTDTVYGLATLAFEPEAIEKLFEIKGRNQNQAIAILIGQATDLNLVAENPSPGAMRLAKTFWPGALTLIVPRNKNVPALLSPKLTIGVRIPNHPFAIELLKRTGPLAVTSANLSGGNNSMNATNVMEQLDGKIDLLIDGGETKGGLPSTVVDVLEEMPKILRAGPISKEEIISIW
jgi:L-threonylcarbamoyladenylate synthase